MSNSTNIYIDLEGQIKWASILEPRKAGDNAQDENYSLEVEISDAAIKAIEDAGISMTTFNPFKGTPASRLSIDAETGKKFLKIKRKARRNEHGHITHPLEVVSMDGSSLIGKKVGNGTTAVVRISIGEYSFQGRKGKRLSMVKVSIINLVEYVPSSTNVTRFVSDDII